MRKSEPTSDNNNNFTTKEKTKIVWIEKEQNDSKYMNSRAKQLNHRIWKIILKENYARDFT